MPARMIANVDGEPTLVVGIPLPSSRRRVLRVRRARATCSRTLRQRRLSPAVRRRSSPRSLGVLLGVFAARRAVRPLGRRRRRPPRRSPAAGSTPASSRPTTPTSACSPTSFNDMAAALQQRVERDARFACDVSHELRSPLMTLSASVEVMQARRDEMPERAQAALDLLVERRRPLPAPGRGPPRDLPLRRRRDPPAPRGPARRPSSSARPSPSAACRTRRSTVSDRAEAIDHPRRPAAAGPGDRQPDRQRPGPRRRRARRSTSSSADGRGRAARPRVDRRRGPRPGRARRGARARSSSASPAAAAPAGAAAARAPASAWRSSTSTCACTAAGCGSRTAPTASRGPAS